MNPLSFFLLLLTATCLAIPSKDSLRTRKQSHFHYEGTLSTRDQEIPVEGELFYSCEGNTINILDKTQLEFKGRTFNINHLITIDTHQKNLMSYLAINNKCIASEFSDDEGTFPRLSEWKEIGNNKFERSFSSTFSLNKVLKSKLGDAGDEEHQVRMRLRITWAKNQIKRACVSLFVDGEKVATKSVRVTEVMNGKVDPKVFRVINACKRVSAEDQKKAFDLQMKLLGVDFRDQSDKSSGAQTTQSIAEKEEKGSDEKEESGIDGKEENESDEKEEGCQDEEKDTEDTERNDSEEKGQNESKEVNDPEDTERNDSEEKGQNESDEKARKEPEEKGQNEADEKARKEPEEKGQNEADEKVRKEPEEKGQNEADEKVRKEPEEKVHKETEDKGAVPQESEKADESKNSPNQIGGEMNKGILQNKVRSPPQPDVNQ